MAFGARIVLLQLTRRHVIIILKEDIYTCIRAIEGIDIAAASR